MAMPGCARRTDTGSSLARSRICLRSRASTSSASARTSEREAVAAAFPIERPFPRPPTPDPGGTCRPEPTGAVPPESALERTVARLGDLPADRPDLSDSSASEQPGNHSAGRRGSHPATRRRGSHERALRRDRREQAPGTGSPRARPECLMGLRCRRHPWRSEVPDSSDRGLLLLRYRRRWSVVRRKPRRARVLPGSRSRRVPAHGLRRD